MVKVRQAGQTRPARRWISLVAWGSLALGMPILTGCSTTTPTAASQAHDPLHGVLVPPGALPQPTNSPKSTGLPVAPTTQSYNQRGAPGLPASFSSSNPASLAAGSWQGPLGRPLAIDDNNSQGGPPFLPGQLTGASKTQQVPGTPGFLSPNPNPKVEIVPDIKPATGVPVTPIGSWQSPQPNQSAVQPASAPTPTAAETLAQQLRDRGVLSQKQDVVPEGVRLTCYVSNGPIGGVRILEVTAADFASAAQAILQQLAK